MFQSSNITTLKGGGEVGNNGIGDLLTVVEIDRLGFPLCMNMTDVIYWHNKQWNCRIKKDTKPVVRCDSSVLCGGCNLYKPARWKPKDCRSVEIDYNIEFTATIRTNQFFWEKYKKNPNQISKVEYEQAYHGFLGESIAARYLNKYCKGFEGIKFDIIFGNYHDEIKTIELWGKPAVVFSNLPNSTIAYHFQIKRDYDSKKVFDHMIFIATNKYNPYEGIVLGILHKTEYENLKFLINVGTPVGKIEEKFDNWAVAYYMLTPIDIYAETLKREAVERYGNIVFKDKSKETLSKEDFERIDYICKI